MPIYVYQADEPQQSCTFCEAGFEFMPRNSEVVLERCPKCRSAVHRVLGAVNTLSSDKQAVSAENAGKAGFAVYEKTGDGTYERTSGTTGPKVLKT